MDEPEPWRPLSRRADTSYEQTLYDGLPDHLAPSVVAWLPTALAWADSTPFAAVKTIERRLHRIVASDQDWLAQAMLDDGDLALDVLDAICDLLGAQAAAHVTSRRPDLRDEVLAPVLSLARMLDEAGSAWKVGGTAARPRLERRVDVTVEQRARAEVDAGGLPGRHLAAAWFHLYGRHPDPDRALDEANKALEAAAKPVVSPQNQKTTLGTVIRDLRAKPEKWTTSLGTVELLIERLSAFCTVQQRHATDAPSVEPDVVEAAVHDAITLVHWFTARLVRSAS